MTLAGPGDAVVDGLPVIVEAAEEEGGVREVLERFGPVVQLGLEVLLGDPVPGHGLEGQDVFPHEAQELTGTPQLIALGGQDGISAGPFGIMLLILACW